MLVPCVVFLFLVFFFFFNDTATTEIYTLSLHDALPILFVAGYLQFDRDHLPVAEVNGVRNAFCMFRGAPVSCGPRGLKGEPDHLFHNNGDGTFTDVSEKAGVADKAAYYGLGAVFADVNNDGKPDLIVGNDSTPNYLYLNKGNGTFQDVSYDSGFAVNGVGQETASMGLAVGDYENNGRLDIFDRSEERRVGKEGRCRGW